eukprot:c8938_g1_i1.p1 GENE.c8938_g1_i1~~c8938_g1_i1.p1  ORF type:complete len:527 (-),score=86.38 c8938_g1_i1:5-1492(-)
MFNSSVPTIPSKTPTTWSKTQYFSNRATLIDLTPKVPAEESKPHNWVETPIVESQVSNSDDAFFGTGMTDSSSDDEPVAKPAVPLNRLPCRPPISRLRFEVLSPELAHSKPARSRPSPPSITDSSEDEGVSVAQPVASVLSLDKYQKFELAEGQNERLWRGNQDRASVDRRPPSPRASDSDDETPSKPQPPPSGTKFQINPETVHAPNSVPKVVRFNSPAQSPPPSQPAAIVTQPPIQFSEPQRTLVHQPQTQFEQPDAVQAIYQEPKKRKRSCISLCIRIVLSPFYLIWYCFDAFVRECMFEFGITVGTVAPADEPEDPVIAPPTHSGSHVAPHPNSFPMPQQQLGPTAGFAPQQPGYMSVQAGHFQPAQQPVQFQSVRSVATSGSQLQPTPNFQPNLNYRSNNPQQQYQTNQSFNQNHPLAGFQPSPNFQPNPNYHSTSSQSTGFQQPQQVQPARAFLNAAPSQAGYKPPSAASTEKFLKTGPSPLRTSKPFK